MRDRFAGSLDLLRRIAVGVNHEAESAIRGWARTNPLVAEFQRRVDQIHEEVLVQAFVDVGIDKQEAHIIARIGLTILVGTQQIEDKVDRERLDSLFSEYQRWLGFARGEEAVLGTGVPSKKTREVVDANVSIDIGIERVRSCISC